MKIDKDSPEQESGWLAQELIPVICTVPERRSVRELLVRYRWIIALCLSAIVVAIFAYSSLVSNPRYTVETRTVSPDGTVTYQPEQYAEYNHTKTIAAIRLRTFDRIYHGILYDGLEYSFSKSGCVYAIEGDEYGAPFHFVHSWDWSGDPHQFPYYTFSHTWRKGEP